MINDPSIILDFLISQNSGTTLSFDKCPLNLLKEGILRGFEIRQNGNIWIYAYVSNWYINPLSRESGAHLEVYSYDGGEGQGWGRGDGIGNGNQYRSMDHCEEIYSLNVK